MLSRRLVYALALNLIVGAATSAGALADEDHASANRTYAVSVLNLPATAYSAAAAIANDGQIVGQSGNGAVLVKGTVTNLPTPADRVTSWALGLNEHNEVVGGANDAQGVTHAVVWRNKTVTELPNLPGGTQAAAHAVNERGAVVGYSSVAGGSHHAVVWERRSSTDLGVLPGDTDSEAYGINDRGEIVGHSWNSHLLLADHAVVWRNGAISALPSTGASEAYGINSEGKIVGQANGHAALWNQQGRLIDLGAPAGSSRSWAKAINDHGDVVGGAYGPDGYSPEAVLFSHGSAIVLGSMPNGTQSEAYAINNHGDIAGYSYDAGVPLAHAVAWKPSRS